MSNENNVPPNSPTSPGTGRRASFSPGQTISEIFGAGARSPSQASAQFPGVGPITTAAANAQRRRLSISGASPTQSAGFFGSGSARQRRESMSSQGSTSTSSLGNSVLDENAVEEGDGPTSPSMGGNAFARRVSFGARALRDARTGSVGSASAGFNLSDSLKNRAESTLERNSSISERRRSDAVPMQPAPAKPVEQQRPDAFQERILKGDFYMD